MKEKQETFLQKNLRRLKSFLTDRTTRKYYLDTFASLFTPIGLNNFINTIERNRGTAKVLSYPTNLGMNISNLCNQRCRFCGYDYHRKDIPKNWVTPEMISKMKWLKYIESIHLFAGWGDPLTNPKFPAIARQVKKLAPKSELGLFTNGLAMSGDRLQAIVENCDFLHVSFNAATEDVYNKLILRGNFQKAMGNLRRLSELKPDGMYVEISMVLVRSSLPDVQPMIDLIKKLSFNKLIIANYMHYTVEDDESLDPAEESLLNDPQAMAELEKLKEYARQQQVIVDFPDLKSSIGANVAHNFHCTLPWREAYISNGFMGERNFQCCCSGTPRIELSDVIYQDFKKVWNSERMMMIRRTVNSEEKDINNMCYLCKMAPRKEKDYKAQLAKVATERGILWDEETNLYHPFEKIEI